MTEIDDFLNKVDVDWVFNRCNIDGLVDQYKTEQYNQYVKIHTEDWADENSWMRPINGETFDLIDGLMYDLSGGYIGDS